MNMTCHSDTINKDVFESVFYACAQSAAAANAAGFARI